MTIDRQMALTLDLALKIRSLKLNHHGIWVDVVDKISELYKRQKRMKLLILHE